MSMYDENQNFDPFEDDPADQYPIQDVIEEIEDDD